MQLLDMNINFRFFAFVGPVKTNINKKTRFRTHPIGICEEEMQKTVFFTKLIKQRDVSFQFCVVT